MKARPILFSGSMVRALLDGHKSQTRRLLKADFMHDPEGAEDAKWYIRGYRNHCWDSYETMGELIERHSPYGQPGDLLWVRETINRGYCDAAHMSHYAADGFPTKADWWPWQRNVLASIHCPQGLSRITLRITSVRVERLQEISQKDAIAEGISMTEYGCHKHHRPAPCLTAVDGYRELWESINGAGAWDKNPWVWCVGFEVIKENVLEVIRES